MRSPRALVPLAFVLIASATSAAHSQSGIREVDSAAVARAAWRRGQNALRARDCVTADTELSHAASAWPTQPVYLWGRALGAACVGDTIAVLRALTSYADLSLGDDVHRDALLAPFIARPEFAAVVARLERNRKPDVHSRVALSLSDSTIWPEGMDYDSRARRWYIASVRHRTIVTAQAGDSARDLWPRGKHGFGAMLAVRVDTLRSVLWATTSGISQMLGYTAADSGIAALLKIRPRDGAILARWDLPPVARGHVLGDVAIGLRGDVYLTDSNEPVLYRLRGGRGQLERITSPFFRSLQGIAPSSDGGTVYVADYSHGILRVDLISGAVTRVQDAPHSTSLGCDGIVWYRDGIIAIQNGVSPARVVRFTLDASGSRFTRTDVLDQNSMIADEPTIGTIVGDTFVYVANSQWDKHADDGSIAPGAILTPPILLSEPLSESPRSQLQSPRRLRPRTGSRALPPRALRSLPPSAPPRS